MNKEEYDFILNAASDTEQSVKKEKDEPTQAFLTVKVDIDCSLLCDGEPLCSLTALKAQKVSIPLGNHLLSLVSVRSEEFVRDETIKIEKQGENKVLILTYKNEETNFLHKLGIVKTKEEEYESLLNEKITNISKLEGKLTKAKTDIKKLQEDLTQQKDNYELIVNEKEKDISSLEGDIAQLKQTLSEQKKRYESNLKDKDRILEQKEEELAIAKAPTINFEAKLKEKDSVISDLQSKLTETQNQCNKQIKEKEQECAIQVRDMRIENECLLDKKDKEHTREIAEMRQEFTQFKNRIKEEIAQRDKNIAYLEAHLRETVTEKKSGGLFSKLMGK